MAIVRINHNVYESGEEYSKRLGQEIDSNFRTFLQLLSSYWQSTVDGPNYTRQLKAQSNALAQLRLSLEDIRTDTYYDQTRTDFLYQTVTQFLFPDGAPVTDMSDLEFRDFLLKILGIYFQGSTPKSMTDIIRLFIGGSSTIQENFIEARRASSGLDISDEFGFSFDVLIDDPGAIDIISLNKNIHLLLDISRPGHTIYKVRYVISDEYTGNQTGPLPGGQPNKILDGVTLRAFEYDYEDFRKFSGGVERIDLLGTKKQIQILNESHDADF